MGLFVKRSAIINVGILLKSYKKCIRRNWSQSKDKTNIFEVNKIAGVKNNNRTTINSDYGSDNI